MDKINELATELSKIKARAIRGEKVDALIRETERALDKKLDELFKDWPEPKEVGSEE